LPPTATLRDSALVVLIDRARRPSAEIVAGALRDHAVRR